jgi:hypothetical protein
MSWRRASGIGDGPWMSVSPASVWMFTRRRLRSLWQRGAGAARFARTDRFPTRLPPCPGFLSSCPGLDRCCGSAMKRGRAVTVSNGNWLLAEQALQTMVVSLATPFVVSRGCPHDFFLTENTPRSICLGDIGIESGRFLRSGMTPDLHLSQCRVLQRCLEFSAQAVSQSERPGIAFEDHADWLPIVTAQRRCSGPLAGLPVALPQSRAAVASAPTSH